MPDTMPSKPQHAPRIYARVALAVMLFVVAGAVLARNKATVRASLHAARGAHAGDVLLGGTLMALTFCIAAAIYGVLALHRLRYRQTLLIEVATAFMNRLLPSGLGGLGIHGLYLYRRGHTGAEATVVVSVNNLLGMLAHLVLLAAVLLLQPSVLQVFVAGRHLQLHWWWVLVAVLVCAGIMAVPAVRRRLASFVRHLLASVRRLRVARLSIALPLAAGLTAAYTLILYVCMQALDVRLSLLQAFVVFSIGMLTSTATPTPGGLVGAEAGLFGGLVAYSVPAAPAGAVVLLYRLITYWLPLLPGLLALSLAHRRKLL